MTNYSSIPLLPFIDNLLHICTITSREEIVGIHKYSSNRGCTDWFYLLRDPIVPYKSTNQSRQKEDWEQYDGIQKYWKHISHNLTFQEYELWHKIGPMSA